MKTGKRRIAARAARLVAAGVFLAPGFACLEWILTDEPFAVRARDWQQAVIIVVFLAVGAPLERLRRYLTEPYDEWVARTRTEHDPKPER